MKAGSGLLSRRHQDRLVCLDGVDFLTFTALVAKAMRLSALTHISCKWLTLLAWNRPKHIHEALGL